MKHNILLVDDVRSNMLILKHILRDLGHQILTATSGEEAIKLAADYEISVALIDVHMPGMSGYEVASRLREMNSNGRVLVIFVTGSAAQVSQIAEGYNVGGVDYLVKPVEPIILRRKVEVFCDLQEKEKQIEKQLKRIERQNLLLESQVEELTLLENARMESEIRYRSLVTLSPQAIVVQVAGELVFYNTMAIQILGAIDDESIYSRPFHTFVVECDRDRVMHWLAQIERQGGRWDPIECTLMRNGRESTPRHVELHACCILYDDVTGVQMAIQDITEHKILQQHLQRLSQVDGLTGVWNRRCFDEHIDMEWRRLARNNQPLSLLMIDLDQFKKYNDTYGHLEGDACLVAVAELMKGAFNRPADLVARYGGEEFVVLLPETNDAGARQIAHSLVTEVHALKMVHEHNRDHGVVTISCGVATMWPSETTEPEQLIKKADDALYRVKETGGNGLNVAQP